MIGLAASGLAGRKLLEAVVGALVAGLGVTAAFSALIYASERAVQLRRGGRRRPALAASAGAAAALIVCLGLVAAGLVLVASKPK
jgi:hypothetical protein